MEVRGLMLFYGMLCLSHSELIFIGYVENQTFFDPFLRGKYIHQTNEESLRGVNCGPAFPFLVHRVHVVSLIKD